MSLNPSFREIPHLVPDPQIVEKNGRGSGRLPDRSLPVHGERPDRRSGATVEPALFPLIAADALSRRGRHPETPQASADTPGKLPRVLEEETSNSLWMQIRLELKQRLSPMDHANWVAPHRLPFFPIFMRAS